jgi:hypothetical protein
MRDFGFDGLREARHFTLAEREAFAQRQRPERAIEVEHTRALRTLDMHVRGPMIVRIDHDAGAGYAKQCGHGVDNNLTLGFWSTARPAFRALSCTGSIPTGGAIENTA